MMENQSTQLKDLHERIKNGDAEAASELVSTPIESFIQEEDFVTISEAPEPIETPEEVVEVDEGETEAPEVSEEEDEEFVNKLEEQRKIHDERERDHLDRELELKKLADESKKENEMLLKQMEDLRKEKDRQDAEEEFSLFSPEEETSSEEPTPTVKTTDNSMDETTKRLLDLEAQLEAKKIEDANIRDYTRFWDSEVGKDLKPKGMDADTALKKLDGFFDQLTGHYGNETDATRALYDLRNPETGEFYGNRLKEAGIEAPVEFEKLYDTWTVQMFKSGHTIDPITGKPVKTRKTQFESLDEAYFIMNKDKLLFESKMEVWDKVSGKVEQHNQAATPIPPAKATPIGSQTRVTDKAWRQSVLKSMAAAGIKPGQTDVSTITDPVTRANAEELIRFINGKS